jgi:predicted transcriptional regulator
MDAITIQIPPSLIETLTRAARENGVSTEDLAGLWLQDRAEEFDYSASMPLSAHEIEGIERGLADAAAGRVYSHEEVLADLAKWRLE